MLLNPILQLRQVMTVENVQLARLDFAKRLTNAYRILQLNSSLNIADSRLCVGKPASGKIRRGYKKILLVDGVDLRMQ